jgi:hypothetical protein
MRGDVLQLARIANDANRHNPGRIDIPRHPPSTTPSTPLLT